MEKEAALGLNEEKQVTERIRELAMYIADAAWDKKAQGLEIFDVGGLVSYADYIVICSGNTDRHVLAIVNSVDRTLRDAGVHATGIEGKAGGTWVLMDYGDIVVHVFSEAERDVYGLDSIWSDTARLEVEAPPGLERPDYV